MMKWAFDKTKDYRAEHMQKAEKYRLVQQIDLPKREELPARPTKLRAA